MMCLLGFVFVIDLAPLSALISLYRFGSLPCYCRGALSNLCIHVQCYLLVILDTLGCSSQEQVIACNCIIKRHQNVMTVLGPN